MPNKPLNKQKIICFGNFNFFLSILVIVCFGTIHFDILVFLFVLILLELHLVTKFSFEFYFVCYNYQITLSKNI